MQTRNRGTIGGSVVHGDASAEIALVACVLDAMLDLRDTSGATEIPAREFFLAPMVTAILPEQCLAEIRFPLWRGSGHARRGCAFEEVSVRHGDFALVSACAQLELDADGRCARAELGVGGAASVPLASPQIGAQLIGLPLEEQTIAAAAAAALDLIDPEGDLHATADYRRHLARILVERVLRAARDDALGGKREAEGAGAGAPPCGDATGRDCRRTPTVATLEPAQRNGGGDLSERLYPVGQRVLSGVAKFLAGRFFQALEKHIKQAQDGASDAAAA